MGHTRNVPEAQPERDKRDRKQSSERRTKENCDSRHVVVVLTSDEDLEQQTAARVLKAGTARYSHYVPPFLLENKLCIKNTPI